MNFGERFARSVASYGPLCIGVDPSPELLEQWGLGDNAIGLRKFGEVLLEAGSAIAGFLKPQVAFFERHGSNGFAALESLITAARSDGWLVIADAKRGDIGSTARAYGAAWVSSQSSLCCDAVTLNPYLGVAALTEIVDIAFSSGNGAFIVARSSNAEGETIQGALQSDGTSVAGGVIDSIRRLNSIHEAGAELGSVGAVIGANAPWNTLQLDALGGPVLVPGLGAQGGTADSLQPTVGLVPRNALTAAVSRDILQQGPDPQNIRERCIMWQNNLSRVRLGQP